MQLSEVLSISVWVLIFLYSIVLHELCHGLAAYVLGDPTAQIAKRLTLNPLRHIDLMGTVILPLMIWIASQGRFIFGMAKPVPVNFSRLRKIDMIWVSLAGPAANILLAMVLAILFHATEWVLVLLGIYLNLGLACFNLIPIPPLDGSKVLAGLLPSKAAHWILQSNTSGYLLIFALYFLGILPKLVFAGINAGSHWLNIPDLESLTQFLSTYAENPGLARG